jgi:hypothetical protein
MGRTSNSYLNLTVTTNNLSNVDPEDQELALANKNKFSYGQVVSNNYIKSLFSSKINRTEFKYWPSTTDKEGNAISQPSNYPPHNDDIYKINPSELVDWSQRQSEALKFNSSDFAYLKNIGVYPNNRLIIARRFQGPVGNDLSVITQSPLAILIDWVKEDSDFFNISYSEEWIDADASFTNILNDMGESLKLPGSDNKMGSLGGFLAEGGGLLPLPGLVEGLQYRLFQEMGISDFKDQNGKINGLTAFNGFLIPTGDPNLIREAKRRKTLGKGGMPGSGLKSDFEVKMSVEYEMKFINGIDPTIVYFDIIANALSFATSPGRFQFNNNFYNGGNNILNKFISGNVSQIKEGLKGFISSLFRALASVINGITNLFSDKGTNTAQDRNNSARQGISESLNYIIKNTFSAVIEKYKVALIGVISSLTGVHSTPWHVTIGNPKRPSFCSGDMYVSDCKMSMGPILGFNDLPSSIKLDVTLKPARNLGAEEIYDRFNLGKGRSYKRPPDTFYSSGFTNSDLADVKDKLDKDDEINKLSNQFNKSETPAQKEVRDILRQSGNSAQAPGVDSRGVLTGRQGTGGGQL